MKTEQVLAAYRNKREQYVRFSQKVKELLEITLKNHGTHYLLVTNRAKEVASLERKFANGHSAKRLQDIDDLAGCRIIIYLDSEIEEVLVEVWGSEKN
ncbi:hypothetical protein HYW84_00220 [Candidatus Peregrinibacteria bacterium]|nr:hypothetical protein [Candidatus Peregrinibacteria bacterium]